MGRQFQHFDSLEELAAHLDAHESIGKTWAYESHDPDRGRDWDLGDGWSGCKAMLRDGWPEGRDKMLRLQQNALNIIQPSAVPAQTYDVAGAYPVAAIAAAGDPMCMVDIQPTMKAAAPTVRILVHNSYSHMVKADSIFNYGAAVAAWVDYLESQEVRVQLDIATPSQGGYSGGGYSWLHTYSIKRASEPLDIDRVAFALSHPGFFRRFWFRLIELDRKAGENGYAGGYGRVRKLDSQDDTDGGIFLRGCAPLGGGPHESRSRTMAGAVEVVREQIEAEAERIGLGISLTEDERDAA